MSKVSDEGTIEGELTVDDIVSEAAKSKYHTILELWRELLKASEQTRKEKVSPQWAVKVTTQYNEMTYADMDDFTDEYYDRVDDLRRILDAEIDTDDECLNFVSAEEDREGNGYHYINVLTDWQKQFLMWELDWNCGSPSAAIEVAVLSELHKMFFGELGITNLLDQINFEFTDSDRDALATALRELALPEEEE